jgi:hypothetical protein
VFFDTCSGLLEDIAAIVAVAPDTLLAAVFEFAKLLLDRCLSSSRSHLCKWKIG